MCEFEVAFLSLFYLISFGFQLSQVVTGHVTKIQDSPSFSHAKFPLPWKTLAVSDNLVMQLTKGAVSAAKKFDKRAQRQFFHVLYIF